MKISVIVPVYNVEPYLERCLTSIQNNTYTNLEIICINDGSTDGCAAILNRFAAEDRRFIIITQENAGISAARNRGLDIATGEFIAFVDSDDWIHPQYFETMAYYQKLHQADMVVGNYKRVSEVEAMESIQYENIDVKIWSPYDIYKTPDRFRSSVWGRIYRSELLKEKRFMEMKRVIEDCIYNAVVLGDNENIKICYIPVELYYYFNRPGSLIYQIDYAMRFHVVTVFHQLMKETSSTGFKRVFLIETLKRALSVRYGASFVSDRKEEVRNCNHILKACITELWRLSETTGRERMQYTMFYIAPWLYRLIRIIDDPTMLAWEKQMKKLRKREQH